MRDVKKEAQKMSGGYGKIRVIFLLGFFAIVYLCLSLYSGTNAHEINICRSSSKYGGESLDLS